MLSMKRMLSILLAIFSINLIGAPSVSLKSLRKDNTFHKGFVGHIYDAKENKLYLKIDHLEKEFIYQSSLPQGLGSNDIGLDRGQLNDVRLVEFNRVGNKLLLKQKNTKYRAISSNAKESQSVEEAFASAILWSFPVVESNKDWVLVDASDFILQDAHGVSRKLEQRKQGSFRLDKTRSAIYLPRTKSFPDNTELEASITFTGDKPGQYVQQAAIDPNVLSLRMHHSFIRLPKPGYKTREFHPESGYWLFDYQDYAQPISRPITTKLIGRHRLEKKNPQAEISEAVEPIIYYLDPGAPEPVKTALIKGASWWNQAFESIGYKDAFQVKILPDNADPLDVRYNVIQWVHRATRGWSYGYGVTDPRTGEIIKGHVTLGSLRVRQDYLIAQGMLSKFDGAAAEDDTELMNLALARIRQLSAHEVGHTLGLAHNFAASSYNRASVMDYPHPLFEIDKQSNKIVTVNAYAENIGVWDKATIEYGYQDFHGKDESVALDEIIKRNNENSMLFISDPDSRRISDAHPQASLWDNGSNTIDEMERVAQVRALALSRFGKNSLHTNRPYSDLREILVPVYYFHRYQATAAAKWLGGIEYRYQLKEGAGNDKVQQFADVTEQNRALKVLLDTLAPEFLRLSKDVTDVIPPRAYGDSDSRESSIGNAGKLFDVRSLAAASIQHTFSLILEPTRLVRLELQNEQDNSFMNVKKLGQSLHNAIVSAKIKQSDWMLRSVSIDLLYSNYLNLLHSQKVPVHVKMSIYGLLLQEKQYLQKKTKKLKTNSEFYAFYQYQLSRLQNLKVDNLTQDKLIQLPKMPPGSPI